MEIKVGKRFRKDLGDLSSLKKSIQEIGLLHPIVVDPNGNLIAGERRFRACNELGIDPPYTVIDISNPIQAELDENRERVDFTYSEIYEIGQYVNKTESRKPGPKDDNSGENFAGIKKPIEKVAEITGVSDRTISKINTIWESGNEDIKQKVDDKKVSVDKAYKQVKTQEKKEEKERIAESAKDLKIKIDFRLGDCESIFDDIPDGSIDCIITDPPYPFEFINTWSKLSKLAKRVLKPNGFCIAYSGQMYLPEVLKRMSEHLDYYWMFNLRHSGNYQLIMGRNIFASWKPLLIFQNGFKKLESPIEDLVHGTGMSKDHHRWEQAIDELKYLIENFTEPGQTILDPFSGSGTTLIASYKLNRKPMGCELSEVEFNNAKRRIHDDLHI